MIAIPAVDIHNGVCVLPGDGSDHIPTRQVGHASAVARTWSEYGFRRLHVVDLDAATGNGSNLPVVEEILRDDVAEIQVGGGVRSTEAIEQLYSAGANRVVVGTRAIEDPSWLADVAGLYPGVIVVATDVRDRRVVTRGWVHRLPVDVVDVVRELGALPLAGVLVTALHLDGQVRATDLALLEDVAEASHVPVIA